MNGPKERWLSERRGRLTMAALSRPYHSAKQGIVARSVRKHKRPES